MNKFIKLSNIINTVSRYHYFVYDKNIKKIISYHHTDMNILSSPLKEYIILTESLKRLKDDHMIIMVQLKCVKKKAYELEKVSPLKTTGGPLYGEVTTYLFTDGNTIKEKTKIKNKIYFPKKYIFQNYKEDDFKWIKHDIKKIAIAYIDDMIRQNLFYINTIYTI
jgi:hypothetical protein